MEIKLTRRNAIYSILGGTAALAACFVAGFRFGFSTRDITFQEAKESNDPLLRNTYFRQEYSKNPSKDLHLVTYDEGSRWASDEAQGYNPRLAKDPRIKQWAINDFKLLAKHLKEPVKETDIESLLESKKGELIIQHILDAWTAGLFNSWQQTELVVLQYPFDFGQGKKSNMYATERIFMGYKLDFNGLSKVIPSSQDYVDALIVYGKAVARINSKGINDNPVVISGTNFPDLNQHVVSAAVDTYACLDMVNLALKFSRDNPAYIRSINKFDEATKGNDEIKLENLSREEQDIVRHLKVKRAILESEVRDAYNQLRTIKL